MKSEQVQVKPAVENTDKRKASYRLAKAKTYYIRGTTWTSFIFQIGIVTANLKLLEGAIIPMLPDWLPMQALYVLTVPSYFVGHWFLGYVDFKLGIWKSEGNFAFMETVPIAMDQYVAVIDTKKLAEEIKALLEANDEKHKQESAIIQEIVNPDWR